MSSMYDFSDAPEFASIEKHILEQVDSDVKAYYFEIQEEFQVPCVYFQTPSISSDNESLDSYSLEYMWFIKFFNINTTSAHKMAETVLKSLHANCMKVKLFNKDGSPAKRIVHDGSEQDVFVRIKNKPSVNKVDIGVVQLKMIVPLVYEYPKPGEEPTKSEELVIDFS